MAKFDFFEQGEELQLRYEPDADRGTDWIHEKLKKYGGFSIRRSMHFEERHLVEEPSESRTDEDDWSIEPPQNVTLRMGRVHGDFFVVDKDVLGVSVDTWIHREIDLSLKTFVADGNVSIFRRIAELQPERIVVGGDEPDSIPAKDFAKLLAEFPTQAELRKYARARVANVVRQYAETKIDAAADLERFRSRRPTAKVRDIRRQFLDFEAVKFRTLHTKLKGMLESELGYGEKTWQKEILQIVLLLNPKYIRAFREAPIRDTYQDKERSVDFLLVDAAGHVDIIEIKKPSNEPIVSSVPYRDNFIPLRELSGAIMQVEKYLFHLNKSGKSGEERLTKKYERELPADFTIKITNPTATVIMGRNHELSTEQAHDFEVVRRKYKNVVDIITYDDLLHRLDVLVKQFEAEASDL